MSLEGVGAEGSGHASWTSAMSTFMLANLAKVVSDGTRTSSGFKKIHLNACARAVNEKFKTNRTGDQIKNHLKTWQKKYAKLSRLRRLSAAGWDENNSMITMDAAHYNNHVNDHKSDADYLNKPIENYTHMATIFGGSMATGQYAKDSSSALGTEDVNNVDGDANVNPATSEENGATSASRLNKRSRTDDIEDDGLVKAVTFGSERIAIALEKFAEGNNFLPPDLLTKVQEIPGFYDTHKGLLLLPFD